MKNKKALIIAIFILIISILLYIKYRKKDSVIPPITENQYLIRSAKSMIENKTKDYKKLNANNKSFKDIIHEGSSGIFVGPYRMELAVFKYDDHNIIYGLYLDNLLGQPVYPNKTELFLKINKTLTLPLTAMRNGLLITGGKPIKLPQEIQIFGKLNGKNVNTFVTINSYRQKTINIKQVED